MEINNYQRIREIVCLLDYTTKPVNLIYRHRKKDGLEDSRAVKKESFKNFFEIDMEKVIKICEKHNARCYLSICDKTYSNTLRALFSCIEVFNEWKDGGWKKVSGLHLIDNDVLSDHDKIVDWLKSKGVEETYTIPTRTGKSILFVSYPDLVLEYTGTEFNELNTVHLFPNLNLYIPDYDKQL